MEQVRPTQPARHCTVLRSRLSDALLPCLPSQPHLQRSAGALSAHCTAARLHFSDVDVATVAVYHRTGFLSPTLVSSLLLQLVRASSTTLHNIRARHHRPPPPPLRSAATRDPHAVTELMEGISHARRFTRQLCIGRKSTRPPRPRKRTAAAARTGGLMCVKTGFLDAL